MPLTVENMSDFEGPKTALAIPRRGSGEAILEISAFRVVPCQHVCLMFRNSAALSGSSHSDVIFNGVGFARQLELFFVVP